MTRSLITLAAALLSTSALAQTPATVTSPDGRMTVTVTVNGEGRPDYQVMRDGKELIAPSRLGFLLTDAAKLERFFTIADVQMRAADTTWEQPWGESRYVRDHHNEMRVRLAERAGLKREMDVVFRVFDNGVGFRYEFPDQPNLKTLNISEELTEFNVAQPATAWWIPAGEWNRYEYLYEKTPLAEVGQVHTPLTIRTEGGTHVAFHEAALVDFAGMWLRRVDGQRLRAVLSPSSSGPKVSREAPFPTPWRTMLIADDAPGLYKASDVILNLNEPNKLGDTSWFKPHKYVGVWWGMHLDVESWGSGPKHGATTANTKKYIDFAAKHGFKGVLVEGWNEGWDGDWYNNGAVFSFTKPYPDFDIEYLSSYAQKKGVRLIGHHETSGHVANYESQLDDALDLYERLGIRAIKTGYVADAGQIQAPDGHGGIDYEYHDGQLMSRHHLKVVEEAAKHRIAINPHEPIKDTGLRRTYPNWVSREGARGMEYAAWGNPTNPPEHEPELVFTRMLSGPMDFTPGILSLEGRGQKIQTTIAKQLANYVVIYSPIQMVADLPENYAKHMDAFQFIKDVPADWAETKVLNGEIGDYVTMARKDRNSEDWYLGAVSDEEARTLTAPLSFLTPGKRYRAEIYKDGPGADWQTSGHALTIEKKTVTSADTLTLALAPGGGQAIRFVALR